MQVFVVDAMTGAGKSCGAIRYMNEGDGKYMYVTPYLTEVDRIINGCDKKQFVSPNDEEDSKSSNLGELIHEGANIATTHALFSRLDKDAVNAIKEGGYTLILDEVFEVIKPMSIPKKELDFLTGSGLLYLKDDGYTLACDQDSYSPKHYKDIASYARQGRLILINGCALFWTFPPDIFEAFDKVIVMTYMFDCQLQSYYFEINGVECGRMYVDKDEHGFKLVDYEVPENNISIDLSSKIHIVNDRKYNEIGYNKTALSKAWFNRRGNTNEEITELRRNMSNVIGNKFRGVKGDVMWTTLKQNKKKLTSKGFVKGFVPCNARGTNMYAGSKRLMYCLNVFVNPFIVEYFRMRGIEINQDKYALSEMVQWVYRSAIRKGEDIWIYIPSRRMRTLFSTWVKEVSVKHRKSKEERGVKI